MHIFMVASEIHGGQRTSLLYSRTKALRSLWLLPWYYHVRTAACKLTSLFLSVEGRLPDATAHWISIAVRMRPIWVIGRGFIRHQLGDVQPG